MKNSPVHEAPINVGFEEELDHIESMECSLTLHSNRLFLRLKSVISRSPGSNFTIASKLPFTISHE